MTIDDVEPATKIYSTDAPGGRRYDNTESHREFYHRLDLWNRGDWNGKWRDEERATKKDVRSIFEAIAAQLELTDYQELRGWRIFSKLPDGTRRGNPTALLCICSAAIACREDSRWYHPDRNSEANDQLFQRLLDDLDFSETVERKCYRRVESEVES